MQKNNNKCLCCYEPLQLKEEIERGFHKTCSKKIFGKPTPPLLDYSNDKIKDIAIESVIRQKTIPGVQPKLSAGIEKNNRLTVIGVLGNYILKLQTEMYAELPEIEDLTMHLAQLSKINTAKHTLIRLKSGELVYLTKRMDRLNNAKIHMEDMCQLKNKLTEHKYHGSHEQIARIISKYSENHGLDIINFYELVLFCFLTGNNDMHLKNFSLIKNNAKNYQLSPAYDLVATQLVVNNDTEELALTLDGKKKNIHKKHFVTSMKNSKLNDKTIDNIFNKFFRLLPSWHKMIDKSFLSQNMKENYHQLIDIKFKQIELS